MSQPKQFGPFLLDRMIGRGGMGAVYRATNETTGQIVAVKALLLPLEQERVRFDAEISTLKLLRHENIVKLYGYGQEDGVLYYAMEYVDGPSLSTLLKRGRRFTWEEVVYIGESICRALKHAHDRGVVHRDIKPANILLVNNGIVKVSDYGIAQYFGNNRLTNANQVVGTIEFMAPEQAKAGAVTPKTDMYSLGALMYALLVGKPPYVARTLPELLSQFRSGFPDPIRRARPEVPKIVDDLILELLQIEPDKRPGDARIIGRRLQALISASPNCPNGNPFLNKQFSSLNPPSKAPSIPLSNSRVDLENPSDTTMAKESVAKGEPSERDMFEPCEERAPDFPYRQISDDLEDELDFESPFDKTTERATNVEQDGNDKAQRPEELRDDFIVNESGKEPDPEHAKFGESETSTGEYGDSSEDVEDSDHKFEPNSSSETITLSASAYDVPGAGSSSSSSFDPLDSDASVSSSSYEFEFDGELDSGVGAVSRETGETQTRESLNDLSRPARGHSDKPKKVERAAATTVVEKVAPVSKSTSQSRTTEPQPMQAPIGRNVPFDKLGDDSMEATPLEKFKKSQFTEVGEDELGDLPQMDASDRPLLARFRALVFGLAFAAVICAISYALKAPSADSLYNRVDKKLRVSSEREFNTALRRAEKDMKRFLELYPNDERSVKMNYFLCELEIEELDAKLERQLVNSGRTDQQPNPITRAYLYARKAALEDWELGAIKLRAFIELYGSDAAEPSHGESGELALGAGESPTRAEEPKKLPLAPNRWKTWKGEERANMTLIDQLAEIAKRRLAAVEKDLDVIRGADLALLKDKLITAETVADANPQHAAKLRNAAKALYGDCVWAQEELQKATGEEDPQTITARKLEREKDASTDNTDALKDETTNSPSENAPQEQEVQD